VSKESGGSWSDLRVESSEEKATDGGYTPMTGENTPSAGGLAPGAARGVGGGHSSGSDDEGEHGEAGGGLVWRRPSFAQHQQQARQQARPAACAVSCDMRPQWWNRSASRCDMQPQWWNRSLLYLRHARDLFWGPSGGIVLHHACCPGS